MSLPYYKRYTRDLLDGTVGMKLELKGAYGLILDLIYHHNGDLPDESGYISGQLGCTKNKWTSLKKQLVELGKISIVDGKVTNNRAKTEVNLLKKYSKQQSKNRQKPHVYGGSSETVVDTARIDTEPDTDTLKETNKEIANDKAPAKPLPDRKSIDENWKLLMDGLDGLVPKSRLSPMAAKQEFYLSHKSREPKMLVAAVINYYRSPEVAEREEKFKPALPRVIKENLYEPFIGLPIPAKPLSYAEQRMAYHLRDLQETAQ
tara:strand:+ start:2473 stop:3255 length:783 start_codon:yes stop_codon:yes gene_type:complete